MSIAYFTDLPQGTLPNKPSWEGEKLVAHRYIGRDPLTSRAYFDAVDLTRNFEPAKKFRERPYLNTEWRYMELSVHADMVKIKALEASTGRAPTNGGGGKRGSVRGFSRQSRKRLIEFMSSARVSGQLLFATFTYPDEFPLDNKSQWNADFEALRRRIEREYPDYTIIWRKELKRRKSGKNYGMIAPHYHMIIDTGNDAKPSIEVEHVYNNGRTLPKTVSAISKAFETWALNAWYEIVGSGDIQHRQHGNFTVACRNKLHAYKYVSKYVAKEDYDSFEVGRRWGRIGDWNASKSESVFLTKREYVELMRLAVRWMKSKGNDYGKVLSRMRRNVGCTLFGLGDSAMSGDLWRKMITHASQIAGEMPLLEYQLE